MPSPFPGMNPYLEQDDAWEDFHLSFITHARDRLNELVGGNYLVKIEVRIFLHELSAEERRYFGRADIGLTTARPAEPGSPTAGTMPAPLQLPYPAIDVERHTSLEIIDRRRRRVVTVVELLSPTNKQSGPDRNDYLLKRQRVIVNGTNLVEIDLRRGGKRPPGLVACDYYALVGRALDRSSAGVWPIGLRERLPVIPVPLSAPDPDVPLDLQALLHRVYDAGQYGKYIYGEIPQPPLSEEDAAWARQFVPQPR